MTFEERKEQVEKFMEDFFDKMNLNYYESWDGERAVRPKA